MDSGSVKVIAGIVAVLLLLGVGYVLLSPLWSVPDGPRPLVLSFVPSESNEEMVEEYEPLRAYLERKLGVPVTTAQVTDYSAAIEAMRKGRVDLARFGPLSYVLAEREADAEVFAVEVRNDGQTTYRSLFVVPGDSPARTIEDLRGKTVAFVDPASTSGYLIPSHMVKQQTGTAADQFFAKTIFAGGHDAAELAVKNRTVDAAATNDITYSKMLAKGLITEESNRVIARSDPIPGIPMVWRKGLDEGLKEKIRQAVTTAHEEIKVSGQGKFLRYESGTPADYELIRRLVDELKLQREQLLK